MHHSEVIKLVENFLADRKSVTKEELWDAADACWDAAAYAAHAGYAAYWSAWAAWEAADADDADDAEYWTNKAKNSVARYHELTGE